MVMRKSGTTLAYVNPEPWVDTTVALDVRPYADVEVQLVGLATAYTPQRSLDGTNFVACNAYDKDGNAVSTISADGIYRLPGSGYLKLITGTGATVTIRAGS